MSMMPVQSDGKGCVSHSLKLHPETHFTCIFLVVHVLLLCSCIYLLNVSGPLSGLRLVVTVEAELSLFCVTKQRSNNSSPTLVWFELHFCGTQCWLIDSLWYPIKGLCNATAQQAQCWSCTSPSSSVCNINLRFRL